MNKEQIISELLNCNILLGSDEFDKNKQKFYDLFVDEFVNNLRDLDNNFAVNNSCHNTFMVRKRIGLLDEGVKQTYETIGKSYNVSVSSIGFEFEKIQRRIKNQIEERLLFSALPLDTPICDCLGEINPYIIIKTPLKSLLKLSRKSLNDICLDLNVDINMIVNKVHNLGYFFKFELGLKSNPFIPIEHLNLSHKLQQKLKRYGYDMVYQIIVNNSRFLLNSLNLTKDENEELVNKIHELRFLFVDENSKVYKSIEVKNMGLSIEAHNCLYRNNITTIDQLSLMNKDDLKKIHFLSTKGQKEIIKRVHQFGYLFADETILKTDTKQLENLKKDLIILAQESKNIEDKSIIKK